MRLSLGSVALAACLSLPVNVSAELVWHCSRTPVQTTAVNSRPVPGDLFVLAGMGVEEDVIRISIRDLLDVYSGVPVRLGGQPLSACFMPVNTPTMTKGLRQLGVNTSLLSTLARKSAIAKNHLYRVSDETEMKACIQRNHPAVGYLTQAESTEQLAPCF